MKPPTLTLRCLRRSERRALLLLRGAAPPASDAAILSGFRQLRNRLAHQRMVLPAPAGRYVRPDEAVLLGILAALQQGRRVHGWGGDGRLTPELRSALQECATLIERAGCVLDCGTIAFAKAQGEVLIEGPASRPDADPEDSWTVRRTRILRFLEERRFARACELVALGASRENISSLCRNGSIRRVRHGWYAARPRGRPEVAVSASSTQGLASSVTATDHGSGPHRSG